MNDKLIKSSNSNETITRKCCCYDSDMEINVVCDKGMSHEYMRQLGAKSWVAGGKRVFKNESDMLAFAGYFNQVSGSLSGKRPATDAQIRYLVTLGVKIEEGMSVERASELIDFAKRDGVGCVSGMTEDGSN